EDAEAVFAIDYRGISVPQAAELRAKLRDADATFRVVKNSLTERAAEKAGADTIRALLDGPTALTFVRGDAALAAKALADFARARARAGAGVRRGGAGRGGARRGRPGRGGRGAGRRGPGRGGRGGGGAGRGRGRRAAARGGRGPRRGRRRDCKRGGCPRGGRR